MKTVTLSVTFSLFAVLLLSATAQEASIPFPTSRLTSPYLLDRISVTLTEDLAVPPLAGRTPQELIAASGGAVVTDTVLANGDRLISLRIPTGLRLGNAFRNTQTFDFGSPSRWKMKTIELPGRVFFGESPVSVRRVFNMSARADVRTGEGVTIGGLVIPGNYAQLVVIKVRGSSLSAFGVQQPVSNPAIQLYQGSVVILQNDDWTTLAPWEKELARGVCPSPDDSREAMIVTYLDPGPYTALVSGVGGATGITLLEIYFVDWFYAVN